VPFGGVHEERLPDAKCRPWDEVIVRSFLENRCLLSRDRPTPGRVVMLYQQAFFYRWELLRQGRRTARLEVSRARSCARRSDRPKQVTTTRRNQLFRMRGSDA
jgi:hypothetical protein